MLKQMMKITLSAMMAFAAITSNAQAAENKCMPIDGSTIGEAIDDTFNRCVEW